MANWSKIGKVKSIMKQWRNHGKVGRSENSFGSNSSEVSSDIPCGFAEQKELDPPVGYHTVYVGKSRRRYVVSEDDLQNPLMRVLIHKPEGSGCLIISCEVVLFEHLLWMMKNAEPDVIQSADSLEELVEFYAS